MNVEICPQKVAGMLHKRPVDAHKGTMGHALLVAGNKNIAGCAVLAGKACLRSGVGKVTIHSSESNRIVLQTALPEAIFLPYIPFEKRDYQALGIGPGIGTSAYETVMEYFSEWPQPVVADADAIHLIAEHPELIAMVGNRAILTPHPGEMRHLAKGFGLKENELQEAAQQIAEEHQVVIILKGHPSRIFLPHGDVWICPRGNAGMATAGSGDTLTGILTSLLAQGYNLEEASTLGTWLHATAGDRAAQEWGEESMIARDIIQHLPQAFQELNETIKTKEYYKKEI